MPMMLRARLAVTLFLSSTVAAVSLSDFTPKNTDLPAKCNAAYEFTIPGCSATDFASTSTCSTACVTGLTEISKAIALQCASVDVDKNSIIGVFLRGEGVAALCPNNDIQVTSTSSSSSTSTASTAEGSKTTSHATLAIDTSTPSAVLSASRSNSASPTLTFATPTSTSTSSTATTSSAAIALDTSTGFALQTSSTSSAAEASATVQKSNKDSGGGSPFDVKSTGGAAASRISFRGMAAVMGAVVALTFL